MIDLSVFPIAASMLPIKLWFPQSTDVIGSISREKLRALVDLRVGDRFSLDDKRNYCVVSSSKSDCNTGGFWCHFESEGVEISGSCIFVVYGKSVTKYQVA